MVKENESVEKKKLQDFIAWLDDQQEQIDLIPDKKSDEVYNDAFWDGIEFVAQALTCQFGLDNKPLQTVRHPTTNLDPSDGKEKGPQN